MKIVQINAVYRYGSTGRTVEEFHHFCKKHGVDSYVFCPNYEDKTDGVYCLGNRMDHKLHALLSRITGRQACFSYLATRRLLRELDRINPDAVILRNLHGNYINLPVLLRYLAKKDIVTIPVMHDCWFFTGHCTHYTAHKCYKWQTICSTCPLMKEDNSSLFFDTSERMFRLKKKLFDAIPRLGVIGVSEWITSEAEKSVILSNSKIFRTVYNWIDLNVFYQRDTSNLRKQMGICDEFVVMGVAQGWSWRKGLSHFVELARKMPEIKIILIGSINEKCDMPNNIITPGSTNSIDSLAEFYSLADVLLVCSVQETFGKVSAEALACGTPVIANNATANPEIPGTECGIFVNDNNLDEIIAAVNLIRGEGKSSYAHKCINRASIEFSKDAQAQKYINVIEELI